MSLDKKHSGGDEDVGRAVGGASDILLSCVLALESKLEVVVVLYEHWALFSIHRRHPSFSPVHFTCVTGTVSKVNVCNILDPPAAYVCQTYLLGPAPSTS